MTECSSSVILKGQITFWLGAVQKGKIAAQPGCV
jgi:hypothetical protein